MRCSTEEQALIKLSTVSGLTGRQRALLLSLESNPVELWRRLEMHAADIESICEGLFKRLKIADDNILLEKTVADMDKLGVDIVTYLSDDYPEDLVNIADSPMLLYVKGDKSLLKSKCIAVVGTREPTRYGRDVTEDFVAELCAKGYTIVSGMARGVDTVAHNTALLHGARTIAVLGCGLDKVYPAENKALFDKIAEQGLLVSEYALGESPLWFHFPERNRLISGLSCGVLVTEAGLKSGSLITVDCAVDQGKDIFLVPGNVYSKTSAGSNEKLKQLQGALVTQAADILNFYGIDSAAKEEKALQLDYMEAIVYAAVEKQDMHFEELLSQTKLSVGELNVVLTKLEILGVIKKLPGNYYGI